MGKRISSWLEEPKKQFQIVEYIDGTFLVRYGKYVITKSGYLKDEPGNYITYRLQSKEECQKTIDRYFENSESNYKHYTVLKTEILPERN